MKKILLAFALFFSLSLHSNAQTPPAKAKKPVSGTSAAPTKKDGSADMRYKVNKDSAKGVHTTTHLKKDGTADKRYKENKK